MPNRSFFREALRPPELRCLNDSSDRQIAFYVVGHVNRHHFLRMNKVGLLMLQSLDWQTSTLDCRSQGRAGGSGAAQDFSVARRPGSRISAAFSPEITLPFARSQRTSFETRTRIPSEYFHTQSLQSTEHTFRIWALRGDLILLQLPEPAPPTLASKLAVGRRLVRYQ